MKEILLKDNSISTVNVPKANKGGSEDGAGRDGGGGGGEREE